jgi:hypothetical protein
MNTARQLLAGAGIQTAALAFGGYTPPVTGATEEYDGTSWTTLPSSMGTARYLQQELELFSSISCLVVDW